MTRIAGFQSTQALLLQPELCLESILHCTDVFVADHGLRTTLWSAD